jgi:hypothetical protein
MDARGHGGHVVEFVDQKWKDQLNTAAGDPTGKGNAAQEAKKLAMEGQRKPSRSGWQQ